MKGIDPRSFRAEAGFIFAPGATPISVCPR